MCLFAYAGCDQYTAPSLRKRPRGSEVGLTSGVRLISSYPVGRRRAKDRDGLLAYLQKNGIEAKVHYPTPIHLQPAAAYLGYKKGDFPKAEADSQSIITLPAHQHLSQEEIDYTMKMVHSYYVTGK